MKTEIDWSKAPEGFPIWVESHYKNDPSDWHRQGENCFIDREGGRRDQCQIDQGEATLHFKPDIYTGEGLPPVGTHVFVHDDGSLVYGQGESGEVLAHVDGCAVIRMSYGLGCFLPRCLRTPEQIGADEKQRAVSEMEAQIAEWGLTSDYSFMCQALYDAGYRKQVEP